MVMNQQGPCREPGLDLVLKSVGTGLAEPKKIQILLREPHR